MVYETGKVIEAEWQPNKAEVLLESNRINFGRVRIFSALLFVFHSFLLYRDIAVLRPEGYWARNVGYRHLYELHLILVVVTLIFLFLSPLIKRLGETVTCKFYHGYNVSFAAVILLWSAILAGWVNQHEHGLITEYIIALFGIATAFAIPPRQSFVLFATAQGVFMYAVASMLPDPNASGHYTNSVIMVLLAWVLAQSSYHVSVNSITKRKIIQHQTEVLASRNEELRQKNLRLEELDNERAELMGIVAHDLKNPITAIRGLAEILREEHLGYPFRIQILDQLSLVNDQMLSLVKNLLDINHLEYGKLNWGTEEFDILPIVVAIVERYMGAAEAKNIMLHLPTITESAMVIANEQGTMQVLDNLISNAVKYSPHGKNVFVRVRSHSPLVISREDSHLSGGERQANTRMTSDQSTNDQWLRIEVQDEGPGISEEDMKKLFGKFARLSAQPTGGEHSTGLGLSIVKRMVEAMNGKVWCESELGKGATFIVELPSHN